jgi:hypothetical protein
MVRPLDRLPERFHGLRFSTPDPLKIENGQGRRFSLTTQSIRFKGKKRSVLPRRKGRRLVPASTSE